MRSSLLVAALMLSIPTTATARNVEAGTIFAGAGVGTGLRLGSKLEGSSTFALRVHGEYAITKSIGVIADASLGLGSASPLRFHVGGRYRLADLDLPVSPYGQVELTLGGLFGSLGADPFLIGARLGVGADYFLTGNLLLGLLVAADLDSTTTSVSAFYGTIDILVNASYAF